MIPYGHSTGSPQVLVNQRMAHELLKQASVKQGDFHKLSRFMLLLLYFPVFSHDI